MMTSDVVTIYFKRSVKHSLQDDFKGDYDIIFDFLLVALKCVSLAVFLRYLYIPV